LKKYNIWLRAICALLSAMFICGCGNISSDTPDGTTAEEVFSDIFEETDLPMTEEPETTAQITEALPEETTAEETTAEQTAPPPPEKTEIKVGDFEALKALASGSPEAGSIVRVTNDIEISSGIVFGVPLTLIFEKNVTFGESLAFDTREEGSIEISLAQGTSVRKEDILIEAPLCDVVWNSQNPFETEEAAASYLNVKSFNGIDLTAKYGIGGTGAKRITSFKAKTSDSAFEWSVKGNEIYLAVSYLVNENDLDSVNAEIGFSDGTSASEKLELGLGEKKYTVTDSAGNQRTYSLVTERVTYNLPVFYIEIENGAEVISKEEYLNATVRVDASNAAGGFPSLEEKEVQIRGRGHFSWNFDKTPYKLRFDKKTSVLGLNASKNWVLLANYVDRSLIQNYVAMEMGKVMTNIPYHSTQYPVDVFVNGTYRGVYTFGEQLEAKKERINLEESYTEVDTDYLLEVGGSDDGDVLNRDYFHAGTLKFVAIKHPESEKLTQEQLDYLLDYVKKADEAVKDLSNYEDYIDVDSLIDWVIIHELTYNLDCCFRRSCYLIKEKGGKLKMGPIWDFDLAFGSYRRYTTDNWATVGSEGGYVGITWMNYLKKDKAFMDRFRARWNEIKEPLLEKALSAVDGMSLLVASSADMNFEVWDILGKSVTSQPASHNKYDTYEKMIGRLRSFIENRYKWFDSQLK